MIRVVVADDEALVRDGLRAILEAEPEIDVVAEAADGHEAVRVTTEHLPDVLLMDIRMPHLDGIEACRRLTDAGTPTRVVMLTTFGLDEYVYAALRAGAVGFLLKDARRQQLAAAVRAAATGDPVLAPAVLRRLVESFCATNPHREPPLPGLTAREREVLELVARGRDNGEIAAALFVSESTVKTHLARTLQKLGVRDRVQAVVYAYEAGLVRPGG